MWRTAIISALVGYLSATSPAYSIENTFDSPTCRALAIKLSQDTGAVFQRLGSTRQWAFFQHPFVGEFGAYCEPENFVSLSFSDETAAPAMMWYDTISVAASSIGADMTEVEDAAKQCMRDAAIAENKQGRVERKPLLVACSTTDEPYLNMLKVYFYTDAGWKLLRE